MNLEDNVSSRTQSTEYQNIVLVDPRDVINVLKMTHKAPLLLHRQLENYVINDVTTPPSSTKCYISDK